MKIDIETLRKQEIIKYYGINITTEDIASLFNMPIANVEKVLSNNRIPIEKHIKLNKVLADSDIISLYCNEKMSIIDICKKLRIATAKIYEVLRKNSVILRGRGNCRNLVSKTNMEEMINNTNNISDNDNDKVKKTRGRKSILTLKQIESIVDFFKNGHSINKIMVLLDLSYQSVYNALRKNNVEIKKERKLAGEI